MNIPIAHGASWYAVSTRSRQEKSAAAMLTSLGVCHYLPLVTEVHRWSDRRKGVSVPLFPCYLFVNIENSPAARLQVMKVPGVVKLVGNAGGPARIREAEIESVRRVLAQGVECTPHRYFAAGDRVRIARGALAGIEGTFLRSGSNFKLVLSVEMIQRSVAISVRECDIEPAGFRAQPATRQLISSAACGA
jgi:transcription antitermination factor NusG